MKSFLNPGGESQWRRSSSEDCSRGARRSLPNEAEGISAGNRLEAVFFLENVLLPSGMVPVRRPPEGDQVGTKTNSSAQRRIVLSYIRCERSKMSSSSTSAAAEADWEKVHRSIVEQRRSAACTCGLLSPALALARRVQCSDRRVIRASAAFRKIAPAIGANAMEDISEIHRTDRRSAARFITRGWAVFAMDRAVSFRNQSLS